MLRTKSTSGKAGLFLLAVLAAFGRVHAAAPAPAAAAPPPEAGAKTAAAENHFDVHEYRVLGNTVLSNRDIETVLYPLLGDHKTIADVEIARAALEKAYHDRGFGTVFVDIPEQEIADQIVRLKVTEGRLNEVRIAGARYYSERKILAAVPAAASLHIAPTRRRYSALTPRAQPGPTPCPAAATRSKCCRVIERRPCDRRAAAD